MVSSILTNKVRLQIATEFDLVLCATLREFAIICLVPAAGRIEHCTSANRDSFAADPEFVIIALLPTAARIKTRFANHHAVATHIERGAIPWTTFLLPIAEL